MTGTQTQPRKKRGSDGAARQNVRALEAEVNQGAQSVLGWQVWWDLHQAEGDRSWLEGALKAMGAEYAIPDEHTPEKRLGIAMGRVGRRMGVEFKRAGRGNGHATFRPVVVAKSTDATATSPEHQPTVDATTMSAISVNRDDGSVTLQDPSCHVGQAVIAEYDGLKGRFVSLDLSRAIRSVVEGLHGVRLRNRGGVYFVPSDAGTEDALKALQTLVGAVGDSDLYMPALPRSGEWVRAAQRSTMRSLDGLYAELLQEAEGFATKLSSGDLVSGRSLKVKVDAARALRKRVALYKDIVDDRGKALSKAAEIVARAMTEIADASVEVRAMRKAKGSERVKQLASDMLIEISKRATAALVQAREAHSPSDRDDDE